MINYVHSFRRQITLIGEENAGDEGHIVEKGDENEAAGYHFECYNNEKSVVPQMITI